MTTSEANAEPFYASTVQTEWRTGRWRPRASQYVLLFHSQRECERARENVETWTPVVGPLGGLHRAASIAGPCTPVVLLNENDAELVTEELDKCTTLELSR